MKFKNITIKLYIIQYIRIMLKLYTYNTDDVMCALKMRNREINYYT